MKITQTVPAKPGGYENKMGNTQASGNYKIGQILEARVLTNDSDGLVKLRLGNTEIIASSKIALAQNAHLTLKVSQLQPQLLLQVISSSTSDPLQQAKINMLPRQTSLAPLLAELLHKNQTRNTTSSQHPLRTAGDLLVAAIFSRNNLKRPEGLQRAIRQSGLFLETNLANMTGTNPPNLSSDLKTLLLRYLNVHSQTQTEHTFSEQAAMTSTAAKPQNNEMLPPLNGRLPTKHQQAIFSGPATAQNINLASPDILKKIQGALARLGMLQVATADNFDQGQTLWQLEIPVRQGYTVETVSLTIEREQRKRSEDEQESAAWAVNLSLDLPELGVLQSRINLGKQGLSTTFWSDSTTTLSALENKLSELRANFERQGLQTHNISCRPGQQPNTEPPRPDSPLIDYQI